VISTRSRSFPVQQDVNLNIRDYLIDRCITDTNPTAADAPDDDEEEENSDNIDGDIDSNDKTDKDPSSNTLELLQDRCRRSATLPPTLPIQRFSDSELVRRSFPPAASATLPGRSSSTAGAADSRVKRHRWKLLRKALNLFTLDEAMPADADAVGTTRDAGHVGSDVTNGSGASGATVRDNGAGGIAGGDGTARGNGATDGDSQSDGGTGHSGEEPSQRLGVHSVSVESLPGLVLAHGT